MTILPGSRLVVAPHGEPARAALWDLIARLRSGPLDPVTVAVPTLYAGLSLRREAGARPGGLVNVRFAPLDRIAELIGAPELAAAGRAPVTPEIEAAALRAALAEQPGPFAEVATHPATIRAFTSTRRDLAGAPDAAWVADGRDRTAAAAVVNTLRRARELLADRYDDHDLLRVACEVVRRDATVLADLGPVVLHLPQHLSAGALELVEALASVDRGAAVLGLTGDPAADEPTHALAARLAGSLGPPTTVSSPSAPPTGDAVVSAPDADEEVRGVVRAIAQRLESGTPLHRIAVTYRNSTPYAWLLAEHLAAAGIPAHGPGVRVLAEYAPGRALLGLLRLPERDFARDDVMAVLTGSPVRASAGGPPVPGAWWDGISRRANVVGGLDQWRSRLEAYAAERRAFLEARAIAAGTLFADDVADRGADEAQRCATFVEDLARAVDPPVGGSWATYAAWATGLLDRYVGITSRSSDRVPGAETVALQTTRELVAALANLDGLGSAPTPDAFLAAVEDALDRPAAHLGRFGDGVLLAPLGTLVGTHADTLFVVGLTEGAFPPSIREDPVLDDAARRVGGDGVPSSRDRVVAERVSYLAVLAGARRNAVLSYPRADTRAQRELRPARWLLESAAAHSGRPVVASELAAGAPAGPAGHWFRLASSFEAEVLGAPVASSLQERDVADLARWSNAGRPLSRHGLIRQERGLRDGYTAVRARTGRRLDMWDGVVGAAPGLAPGIGVPLSATSLEVWAQCPFKYFLSRVLRVEEFETPEARDRIEPRVRGTLAHAALQELVGERPPPDAATTWTDADRARLLEIAAELCDRIVADGLAGRPLLWQVDRVRILRELEGVLSTDDWIRSESGLNPIGVEVGFGPDSTLPALTLDLEGVGAVTFRGRIDRVDADPERRRFAIYDYKTGSSTTYTRLGDDPVLGGQRLQLALYALALRGANPDAAVSAWYWFTRETMTAALSGFDLDDDIEARVVEVLTTVIRAISDGMFPAYPGNEGYWGPDNCGWCPYDRICPKDRVRRFQRRRGHPALVPLLSLREPSEDEEAVPPLPDEGPS